MDVLKQISDNIVLLSALVGGLATIWKICGKPIIDLSDKISRIDGDTADLIWDRLVQAHDHYIQRGWASTMEKERMAALFRRYKSRGRNHLAETFFDDVLALPSMPQQ